MNASVRPTRRHPGLSGRWCSGRHCRRTDPAGRRCRSRRTPRPTSAPRDRAGCLRDIAEVAAGRRSRTGRCPADRRDEEILVAVVVDIGERRRDADPVRQSDAGLPGDVLKPPAAGILPELVAADLIHEVDIVQPVAIDVRDGDAGAVIVVHGLVVFARVVDDAMNERDAAGFELVAELKVVGHLRTIHGLALRLLTRRQRVHADIRIGRTELDGRGRPLAPARDRRRDEHGRQTAKAEGTRSHRWEPKGKSIQYRLATNRKARRTVVVSGFATGRPWPTQLSPVSSICIPTFSSDSESRLIVSATSDATEAGSSSRTASVKYPHDASVRTDRAPPRSAGRRPSS